MVQLKTEGSLSSKVDGNAGVIEEPETQQTGNETNSNGQFHKSEDYVLTLKATPERDSYAFNQSATNFIGMVDIKAPLFEDSERAAIDIFCVVDTSGSMSGDRISLLRKSIRRLIRGLHSKDRLAVVEFASNYQVLLELVKMDENGKEKAKGVVNKLRAHGGTHLSGGLLEGLKMVKRRIPGEANDVCSILLFTDGEANAGIRDTGKILAAAEQEAGMEKLGKVMPTGDPEKWSVDNVCQWLAFKDLDLEDVVTNVKNMKIDGQILMHDLTEDMLEEDLNVSRLHTAKFLREIEKLREGDEEELVAQVIQLECTINTFGYGSNHNSDFLEKLAERFDGMYYFIKDTDAINEGFATCLGGLMSTVATNLQLSLTPLNGAANVKILNDFVVSTQEETVTANLGDIQSEEKRHILFEIDLPKISFEKDVDSYCSVKLSYENTISTKSEMLLSSLKLRRENVTGKRDEIVDEQYNRVVVAQALQTADELGRAGQLERARVSLDRAMYDVRKSRSCQTPLSRNLVSDMAETRKGYATLKDYRGWGKQYTKQNRSCYRRERSVRVNDPMGLYSTQSSFINVFRRNTVSEFNLSCSDDSESADDLVSNHLTRAASMVGTNQVSDIKPRFPLLVRQNTESLISTRTGYRMSLRKKKAHYRSLKELMPNKAKFHHDKVPKPESQNNSVVTVSGSPETTKSESATTGYIVPPMFRSESPEKYVETHSIPAFAKKSERSENIRDSSQVQDTETKLEEI